MELTAGRLRATLDYDPATGIFRRKTAHPRFPIGSIAGSVKPRGHIVIRIGRAMYKAHRLAWLYVHGCWPKGQIDHRDCNPSNNSIANLREATNSQNHANARRQPNNTSGFKGVHLDRRRGHWMANIKKDGKTIFLGYHVSKVLAHTAYREAAEKHFGEFARAA